MKVLILGKEVELLIGMDAEFFLQNKDGQYIAAARVIPGLKHEPHVLDNGVCHPDGLSLEVGSPPAKSPEGMVQSLFTVLNEVKTKYLDPQEVTIANAFEVSVSKVQGVQPEDLEFGCGVEYDAHNPTEMVKRVTTTHSDRRYSGFHIHLGFTSGQESNIFTYKDMSRLVLRLDTLFRRYSLSTSDKRASQYGGWGAFRVKPYGIEYRMMDCSVITNPEKLNRLVLALKELPLVFRELSESAR